MRNFLLALPLMLAASIGAAQTHVDGYYRRDGTYVQPHYRSSPNGTAQDNWSTKGNQNPYTGSMGTRDPYSSGGSGYGNSYGSSPTQDRLNCGRGGTSAWCR